MTDIPDWVTLGAAVVELHCSTRGYRTLKTISTQVADITSKAVVLANGARYRMSELAVTPQPASFYRDDPKSSSRYYLLVGPDDPRSAV